MLSPRWSKVIRDLVGNKTRTALVVLSIAVGIFAIGMISSTQVALSRDLRTQFLAASPGAATLSTDLFDDEFADSMRRTEGVADVQGQRTFTLRMRNPAGEWKNLFLTVVPDGGKIRVNKIRPLSGAWPPARHQVSIERASLDFLGLKMGDPATVELSDGTLRELKVSGTTHDINKPPAQFWGNGMGYVSFDTAEWLGFERGYNQLDITVPADQMDKEHAVKAARAVRTKVERSGRKVYTSYVPDDPTKYPADDMIQVLLLLLGALGGLALLLSGFLVVNTVSALLTQQTRQIGVMKAIGARLGQIAGMYLATVAGFGALALLVGIPLGLLAGRGFTLYLASIMNFDVTSFTPPLEVFGIQALIGLGVPVLAALFPVLSAARVSVREALNPVGSQAAGPGRFDRVLASVRGLSRPVLISLRNTFRRKGRLALTLSTLTLGGAIFIAVLSVRESTVQSLDDALDYFKYDVELSFSNPHRPEVLVEEALAVPGVVAADTPAVDNTHRVRPDGSDGSMISVLALPPDSPLIKPTLLAGRWLVPGDDNAVVVNTNVVKNEPDLKVGDELTLKFGDRKTKWRVIGLTKGIMTGPIAYANRPYFEQVARTVGKNSALWVVTDSHDAATEDQVSKALQERFKAKGIRPQSSQTIQATRAMIQSQFDIVVVFLMVMAVLLAVVGGLGLMGTMSLNVIERTREIGVLRAVGASNGTVRQVFIVEAVIIGLISWLVALVVALPVSRLLSDFVGITFIQTPLSYRFSLLGCGIWLGLIVVLAVLASVLPARSASRLSVRDVLAYE